MSDEAAWGDDMRDDDAEWADMEAGKRCEWCRHYRTGDYDDRGDFDPELEWCAAFRGVLIPCEDYEREPGADDE